MFLFLHDLSLIFIINFLSLFYISDFIFDFISV